ncbi:MAG: GNAT family N-acetyltransferase [Anaerolineae bacterium]|nr:GNAT family N-acetyltransferase [Anaerolineae bacterium]
MIELPAPGFGSIRALLTGGMVGHSLIAALLEGNHTGRVFVDAAPAARTPSTALVALTCEFNYVLGRADNPEANAAIRSLLWSGLDPEAEYVVVFPTSEAWQGVLEAMFGGASELHHGARDEYTFDVDRWTAAHGDWRSRIPAGFEVRPYDHALAEGQGFAEFWGSLDAFLERGIGYAVVKDGEAVSRCHTVMVGAGEAEISIETAEPYRRRGMATLAACAFIERCQEVGLHPAWSNWDYNEPSRRLAERLGFVRRGTSPALIARVKA